MSSPSDSDWRKRWRKKPVFSVLTSLRLTVTLLAFSLALVFFGTLDQVNIGINKAQEKYFESFYAVWHYPEEWPMGMRMVLVTNKESDLAKNHNEIAIDHKDLEKFKFLGFLDNTFHGQIKAVFEDSEGKLEPDPNLRFHSLGEIKETLAKEEFRNGFAAILPNSVMNDKGNEKNANAEEGEETKKPIESNLVAIDLEGQPPLAFSGIPIPLPGGYLLGGLLLINLSVAALFRYPLNRRFTGIWITHGGLALMLISELVTDITEEESIMVLDEGQSANFSKDFHLDEFVIIDESGKETDQVLSLSVDLLDPNPDKFFFSKEKTLPELNLKDHDTNFPFILKVKRFMKNADFRSPRAGEQGYDVRNREGREEKIFPVEEPETFRADEMNFRTSVIEVSPQESPEKPIGKWLISSFFDALGYQPHRFEHKGKSYRLEMRRKRYYYPFTVELLDFRFLRYPGTDKPKDFSSDVKLYVPGEPSRETRIYMNHPLNLQGKVFFQAGFDSATEKQTRLQVVRNPGSVLPYIGVAMVGKGLFIQFLFHLLGFAKKRERKAKA